MLADLNNRLLQVLERKGAAEWNTHLRSRLIHLRNQEKARLDSLATEQWKVVEGDRMLLREDRIEELLKGLGQGKGSPARVRSVAILRVRFAHDESRDGIAVIEDRLRELEEDHEILKWEPEEYDAMLAEVDQFAARATSRQAKSSFKMSALIAARRQHLREVQTALDTSRRVLSDLDNLNVIFRVQRNSADAVRIYGLFDDIGSTSNIELLQFSKARLDLARLKAHLRILQTQVMEVTWLSNPSLLVAAGFVNHPPEDLFRDLLISFYERIDPLDYMTEAARLRDELEATSNILIRMERELLESLRILKEDRNTMMAGTSA